MILTLRRAIPLEGTKIELEYSDGLHVQFDLAPALRWPICDSLRSPDYFASVEIIDNETIRWPNGFDICPDVLRFWAESGRVTTPEETDAHFNGPAKETRNVA